MRLSPLFSQRLEEATQSGVQQGLQQGRQEGIQQGLQQERRETIKNLLIFRFGKLDSELEVIIEPLLSLSLPELMPLLLQLSREELLDRFGGEN